MIEIRCPNCEQKHGKVEPIAGVVVVNITARCKNINGDRRKDHDRKPCGVYFEWKLNTTAGDTDPHRRVLEKPKPQQK